MKTLQLIFKQCWRDARAGDLRLLALAVLIAVAAVTSVGFLADRVSRALERDAIQMLGADLVVESPSAIPDSWLSRAQASGLRTVRSWQFPSMVGGDNGLMLASLKGVESGYPLRGALRTVTVLGGPELNTTTAPEIGQVWVDPQILAQTGLKIGQTLKVGDLRLTIARAIAYEPDRGPQFVNLAPRVMLHAEDLLRAGLIATGSRIAYALLIAGNDADVERYRDMADHHNRNTCLLGQTRQLRGTFFYLRHRPGCRSRGGIVKRHTG